MSISLKAVAGVTAAAVVGASMVGCSSNSKSPTTSSSSSGSATSTSHSSASNSAQPQSGDYTKLLIQASDLNAPEEFKASPITQNPNGNAGAETTFSNEDGSNVIRDTIIVMNDPSAAASALDSAKAKLGDSVKGTPGPAAVGTGGTTVSGNSPDGPKGGDDGVVHRGQGVHHSEIRWTSRHAGSTGFRHRRRPEARHRHQEWTPRLAGVFREPGSRDCTGRFLCE